MSATALTGEPARARAHRTAGQSSPETKWHAGFELMRPEDLRQHPAWRGLLGFASPELEEQLSISVRDGNVVQPLVITGADCASGEGFILDGHRRHRAALDAHLPFVPVIRRTQLTAEAEEEILLKGALASEHTRKLKPSQLAAIERRLHEIRSRGRGHRSDLTSVGSNGGGEREDALAAVARDAGQSRNSVADRKKVFSSAISPKLLQEAVDSGAISLTAAAIMIRHTERDEAVREALRNEDVASSAAVQAAKRSIEEQVQSIERSKNSKYHGTGGVEVSHSSTVDLQRNGLPRHVTLGGQTFSMRAAQVAESFVVVEVVPLAGRAARPGNCRREGAELVRKIDPGVARKPEASAGKHNRRSQKPLPHMIASIREALQAHVLANTLFLQKRRQRA
jgi:ParB-like chromosome segregation protein Spo0J